MLVLQLRLGSPEDEVILRDADGNKLCEVMVSKIDRNKVRLVFVAPHQVKINRRSVDEQIEWPGMRECVICRKNLRGEDADGTGAAHWQCAELQKHL